MSIILSAIATLDQHISVYFNTPSNYRPESCPHCGQAGLWCHGVYTRHAQCESEHGCPAQIPRFFCRPCKRTCSVLPEYIPPRRWYHWITQSIAFSLLLMGKSLLGVRDELFDRLPCGPSLSTLQRWWYWLRKSYSLHRFHLCNRLPELGRTANFTDFWKVCLQKMSLASAMNIIHRAGLPVP